MQQNTNQSPPPPQQVIWLLWFALLTSVGTLAFVIFFTNLKNTIEPKVSNPGIEFLLPYVIAAIVLTVFARFQRVKAKAILNRLPIEEKERNTKISKSLVPYLLAWGTGTEGTAIIGVLLYFAGGSSVLIHSYSFVILAALNHLTARPAIAFKS